MASKTAARKAASKASRCGRDCWPISSPNYFYVVDRPLWLWNWSKPGKAVNSSLFAVLLLVTGWVWLGAAVATGLLVLKCVSLVRLGRIGLPVPAR